MRIFQWFVTITPYGKDIEPNVPAKEIVMENFKRLSNIVGTDSVGWRYDTIIVDKVHTVDWLINEFSKMAKNLSGYTKTCVISFIDIYKKVERNMPGAAAVSKNDRIYIGSTVVKIAREYGMTIRPCAEGRVPEAYGADCSCLVAVCRGMLYMRQSREAGLMGRCGWIFFNKSRAMIFSEIIYWIKH